MINKLFFAILLLNVFVAATAAQANPEQAILSAKDQFFGIKNRSMELERLKREAAKPRSNDDLTSKFPQIKKDFEQIQIINIELYQATENKTPVDYSAVLKFVSEINQRALRLKSILFTPEPKAKKESTSNPEAVEPRDIKTLLNVLDKSLSSFAHNSMFRNLKLVSPDASLKAQKDLENVIYASNALKAKIKEATKNNLNK